MLQLVHTACVTEVTPDGTPATISIRNSLHITPQDIALLEEQLVGERNRFICLQLLTMVKEQHTRNLAAASSGDEAWLRQAEVVFLATISVRGRVVGGALFYPRTPKPAALDAATAALPPAAPVNISVRVGPGHGAPLPLELGPPLPAGPLKAREIVATPPQVAAIYIDLMCCNSPGRGYGSLLLRQVERFVCSHVGQLEQHLPQLGQIAGIRLLAVSSAQQFYAKQGYGEPDDAHESFKPLGAIL